MPVALTVALAAALTVLLTAASVALLAAVTVATLVAQFARLTAALAGVQEGQPLYKVVCDVVEACRVPVTWPMLGGNNGDVPLILKE